MKILCINCFKLDSKCKCIKKNLNDIDNNIYKTIMILNQKGYLTRFCCGGHANKDFIYIYISFEYNYKFSNTPEDFKIISNNKTEVFYENITEKNTKLKDKIIKNKIKYLEFWAKNL